MVNTTFFIDLQPRTKFPCQRARRLSLENKEELNPQLDELLAAGMICPSKSSFVAPIMFVGKKYGLKQMCIDYPKLNAQTTLNKCPLPHPDNIYDQLVPEKIMSDIDLRSAYHQVQVKKGDEHKMALICRYGSFEFWL